jgi:hypothetical protein
MKDGAHVVDSISVVMGPSVEPEQTRCDTCYYMVNETEPMPCKDCRTIRSLWRKA